MISNNDHSVLVVEDDPEINALVGAYAQICGFAYRSALNGNTALQEARTVAPAVLVLDLMLPDIDGFEICTRLKGDAQTRDIPIIMLTARCEEEDRQKGLECGAADYLTKPFDPDQLMHSISQHARKELGSAPH